MVMAAATAVCTRRLLSSSACHRLHTTSTPKRSFGRTKLGSDSRQAPIFQPYPISQQQLSSNSSMLKSSSQHSVFSCHCSVRCFDRHIQRRSFRRLPCLAGCVRVKHSAMSRSNSLKEHVCAQSKLSKGFPSPHDRKYYSSNTCRLNSDKKYYLRVCPASLSALQCKTLSLSCQRALTNFPVCHGRYLSKDAVCIDERDGLQEDETVNDDEVVLGSVQDNESEEDLEGEKRKQQFVVVNFYHFVNIEDPHLEVDKHLQFMQGKDIHGRIYINNQGINAQLSGLPDDAMGYADWVKQDSRFRGLLVQVSPSPKGHAFPKLRLRYKPSLVQVEGGTASLPLTNKQLRAVHLDSHEWKEKLFSIARSKADDSSSNRGKSSTETTNESLNKLASSNRRKVILLDVRNGYEWDIGHFEGAMRPKIDCFKNTRFGLSNMQSKNTDSLEGVDKNNVEIMMYCTGGIRCDVYSVILRQKGFRHLYSLKGGIAQYLQEQGSLKWVGNLFVFDSRLAVSPCKLATSIEHFVENSLLSRRQETGGDLALSTNLEFARCKLCGELVTQIRHRNCANLDCNLLFLSCVNCVHHHKGCCSFECTCASRLRPVLNNQLSYDRYDRWHKYRATYLPK